MAPVFDLVSKNQTLKLAFEYLLLALAVFWFKSAGGFWLSLVVLVSLTYLYLRITSQANRFFIAALSSVVLIFVFPVNTDEGLYLILFSLFWALVSYLLIGTKDLLFINRKLTGQLAYFLIISAGAYMLLSGASLKGQIFFFVLCTLLLKELYQFLTENSSGVSLLKGMSLSLIALELSWAISLLPFSPASGLILLISSMYMMHFLVLNYESGLPDLKLVLRGVGILLGIALVMALLSSWSLS